MRRLQVVVAVLALLLVAAVTSYVVIGEPDPVPPTATPPAEADGDSGYAAGTLPDGTGPAVDTAVAAVPLALGYEYRTLEEGLAKATGLMTDGFAEEFRRTFAATAAEQAEKKDAVVSADVRAAGVVRVEDDRVVCLVYVDQVLVSSDTTKNPDTPVQVTQTRVLVGVSDDSGAWLVDSIQPL